MRNCWLPENSPQPRQVIGVEEGVMKRLLILSVGLAAVAAPLSAQPNPQPRPGGPGGAPHGKPHGRPHGPPFGANLTPDEQQRLGAARDKAKNDPTVRSLNEAKQALEDQLATALRAAILAADPSLGPTLDKIEQARNRAKDMRGKFESLTPEQKQQLKAARQAAMIDPAVQAAREAMRSAQGPEAKRDAAKQLRDAVKAAMLKSNPALGPLLEQLGPDLMGPPHRGKGDGQDHPDGPQPPEMGPPMEENDI